MPKPIATPGNRGKSYREINLSLNSVSIFYHDLSSLSPTASTTVDILIGSSHKYLLNEKMVCCVSLGKSDSSLGLTLCSQPKLTHYIYLFTNSLIHSLTHLFIHACACMRVCV